MTESKNIDKKKTLLAETKSLLYVIFLALIIRTFVIEFFYVPTPSMIFTILEGDYIFSTKYTYGYSNYSFPFSPDLFKGRIFASAPQRGDIIIFRPPPQMHKRFVKRLIGLPGDKIQIINDVIHINDRPIEREFVGEVTSRDGERYKKYKETLPEGISYFAYKAEKIISMRNNTSEVFYVPKDKYFFLGDNRDNSDDSRYGLGMVPFENFIAKGQFIIFSSPEQFWKDNTGIVEQVKRIGLWIKSFSLSRSGKSLYSLDLDAANK